MIVKRKEKRFGALNLLTGLGKGGNFAKASQAFKAGGFKNTMKGLGQGALGAAKLGATSTAAIGLGTAAAIPVAAATSDMGMADV